MRSLEAPVESLPFVGKSWRKRGPAYWTGRSVAVLVVLLMTAMVIAMASGVTIGIIEAGASPWIVVPILATISALSSFKAGRSIVKGQKREASDDGRARRRVRARYGGALGYGLSALGGFGALIIAVCMPIGVGIFPVLLWCWLKPLAPGELRARKKLMSWMKVQGRENEIPESWFLDVS